MLVAAGVLAFKADSMDAASPAMDLLVARALEGDNDASVALHERCDDFATARRVVAILALKREPRTADQVADWVHAIRELHPGRELSGE